MPARERLPATWWNTASGPNSRLSLIPQRWTAIEGWRHLPWMGNALSVVCFFLMASPVALCSVEVQQLHQSTQKPGIRTELNGKVMEGVKLEIYRGSEGDKKPLLALITDDKGMVVLPELPPGV
jgi:hypothetical protein